MPQIQPPAVGSTGEKKKDCTISPRPLCPPAPGSTSSWSISGTIVREITFQSSFSDSGTTGWRFRENRVPSSSGPTSRSRLSWRGTLIKAATGFASCMASSSPLCSAAAVRPSRALAAPKARR